MSEDYFYRTADMAVPCPRCGGLLVLGEVYDWPPDRGGNWIDQIVRCNDCHNCWSLDEEDAVPLEFSDPDDPLMWNVRK